jgi:hypothetical protein
LKKGGNILWNSEHSAIICKPKKST